MSPQHLAFQMDLIDWDHEYDLSQRRSAQATAQPRCGCGRFAKNVRLTGDSLGNVWQIVLCSEHGETTERSLG
jgi:hypothetical protein